MKDKQMQSQKDISKLSPDRLMKRFRESKIMACLFVALALHVIVLGGTSTDYIHGLVDPVWKEEQDKLAEAARKAKAAKPAENADADSASTQPATKPAGNAQPKASPTTAPPPAPTERKLPPELTTMPKPGEIPGAPRGGLGIDDMEKK